MSAGCIVTAISARHTNTAEPISHQATGTETTETDAFIPKTDEFALAGDITALVALLRFDKHEYAKQAATLALCNLAHYTDASAAIVQSGAISPLVTLLREGGTDELKEAAATALWILARRYTHAAAIVMADAITPLVAILRTGGTDTLKHAATELLHMLAMNNHMRAIIQAGIAAPLVALLGNNALKDTATELIQTLADGGYSSPIEKARARRNWATARAFAHVHEHRFFWHRHVRKQLSAPGGRAAFTEEFNELRV